MAKKPVEKIRDDLYVRKGRIGYEIVYPAKKEDGTMNWSNIRKALLSDLFSSIPYLLAVAVLLYLLLPGAVDIKERCQEAITQLQKDACNICNGNPLNKDYGWNMSITEDFGNLNEPS